MREKKSKGERKREREREERQTRVQNKCRPGLGGCRRADRLSRFHGRSFALLTAGRERQSWTLEHFGRQPYLGIRGSGREKEGARECENEKEINKRHRSDAGGVQPQVEKETRRWHAYAQVLCLHATPRILCADVRKDGQTVCAFSRLSVAPLQLCRFYILLFSAYWSTSVDLSRCCWSVCDPVWCNWIDFE